MREQGEIRGAFASAGLHVEPPPTSVTVVVPSYDERTNVAPLATRLDSAVRAMVADPEWSGVTFDILYVDDSRDDTAGEVLRVAALIATPMRAIHRAEPTGGLAGAVAHGLREARGDLVVVMDADLQHPPELLPELVATAVSTGADVVVASRYRAGGVAGGLDGGWRHLVSNGSTVLARALFPLRVGRLCTDPMTGFFCVRRSAVDLDGLRPRGFKILLEILARQALAVAEVPLVFGERAGGESKASWRNGLHFLRQLTALRLVRLAPSAAVRLPALADAEQVTR